MGRIVTLLLAAALMLSGCAYTETRDGGQPLLGQHAAVTPMVRDSDWWMPRHEANVERVSQGDVDLLINLDVLPDGKEDGCCEQPPVAATEVVLYTGE